MSWLNVFLIVLDGVMLVIGLGACALALRDAHRR
jgi:hypothetical protein